MRSLANTYMQRHRHTDHSHTDSQAHRFTSSQTYISFDISPGSKYALIKKRGAIFSITLGDWMDRRCEVARN